MRRAIFGVAVALAPVFGHADAAYTATGTITQTLEAFNSENAVLGSSPVASDDGPYALAGLPFNPALGTLESVTLELQGFAEASQYVVNYNNVPAMTVTFEEVADAEASGGNFKQAIAGFPSTNIPTDYSGDISTDAFPFNVNFDFSDELPAFLINTSNDAPDSDLQFLFLFDVSGLLINYPPNNIVGDDNTFLLETATLTYSFLYSVPIPEPTSFAVFGLGVMGLGVVRRRWVSLTARSVAEGAPWENVR